MAFLFCIFGFKQHIMKRLILLSALLLFHKIIIGQSLTATQLLEKSIAFHDPNGNWSTFNNVLHVTMSTPNAPDRVSDITINLPERFFQVKASKDGVTSEYTIDKGKCSIKLNGKSNPTEEELKTHNLSCERANMYKNYYTYLYGLPMKLKDNGTIIHEVVNKKTFKGKTYLTLKVTYDKAVGNDTWYFYFNPKTFALEIYQFFHNEAKNDGEYILLSGMESINGINMPKARAWYTNKDHKYLGKDTIVK